MATVRPILLRCPLDTTAERLAPVIGGWPGPALLESGPGFGDAGRWSFLTAHPRLVFEARGRWWTIVDDRGRRSQGAGDVLEALAHLLRLYRLADPGEMPEPECPPFQGGLIGFFGYDLAPTLERLERRAPPDSRLPDIRLTLHDTFVLVDHATGDVEIRAVDLLEEGSTACERRVRRWNRALKVKKRPSIPGSRFGPLVSGVTRPEYLDGVRRTLEYIAAGDAFQVNLSQRFHATGQPVALDLYLRLKEISPAPFSAFLGWDDLAVVSASPENFYQTRGETIVTRPIKGTRPRGASPEADRLQVDALRSSAKDRAELTMIVDLERNDLGRICRYGSVKVVDALTVESFAQVHHQVATIAGRLRPGAGPVDVVRAVFPGGSITGAPKIRAMEIIDELEPTRRSLYTGAIGYFSRGGTSGFNIAIRTLLVEGERVSYQVGGGIVADSDPESEFLETLHKGRGLRALIEGTSP